MNGPENDQDDPRLVLAREVLARDWASIWQSELAAIAADPELAGYFVSATATWLAARADGAAPSPGAAAPPRAAAAAAPPDPRDAAIERLRERVAELERRLAGAPA